MREFSDPGLGSKQGTGSSDNIHKSEFLAFPIFLKNISMSFLSRSTQLVRPCGPKQAIGRLAQSNARAASG